MSSQVCLHCLAPTAVVTLGASGWPNDSQVVGRNLTSWHVLIQHSVHGDSHPSTSSPSSSSSLLPKAEELSSCSPAGLSTRLLRVGQIVLQDFLLTHSLTYTVCCRASSGLQCVCVCVSARVCVTGCLSLSVKGPHEGGSGQPTLECTKKGHRVSQLETPVKNKDNSYVRFTRLKRHQSHFFSPKCETDPILSAPCGLFISGSRPDPCLICGHMTVIIQMFLCIHCHPHPLLA